MDVTDLIEKSIAGMFGQRGVGFAKLYRRYCNFINSCAVYLLGTLLYTSLAGFNIILAILVLLLWNWSMTTGPLGKLWGFNIKKEYVSPVVVSKATTKWKRGEKRETIEYREVEPNVEIVATDSGSASASAEKDVIVRDATGKVSTMSKHEFLSKYDTKGDK